MSSMTAAAAVKQPVFAGIDTHKATHQVAVVDANGTILDDGEFPATAAGSRAVTGWLSRWEITRIGIEQSGTYGAGLTRALTAAGHAVIDVNMPDLTVRARAGKSDPIDAVMAADAVRTGRAGVIAKNRDGVIESIRLLQAARHSAVKARSTALTQLGDLTLVSPDPVRERLGSTSRAHARAAVSFRTDRTRLHDPAQAAKLALRSVATRISALDAEIAALDKALTGLVTQVAPRLLALPQVGVNAAAQLLVTFGQAPQRISSDAKFARLIGVAPIPASSGKTNRMRLHAGGDRQANKTVHMIAVGRLRNHQPAIDYLNRRVSEGLSKKDAIRAMKRLIARELYGTLKADLRALDEL
jgi:transposase